MSKEGKELLEAIDKFSKYLDKRNMKIEEEFKKILSNYHIFTVGDYYNTRTAIDYIDVCDIMNECYNLGKNEENILYKEEQEKLLNFPHEQLKLL